MTYFRPLDQNVTRLLKFKLLESGEKEESDVEYVIKWLQTPPQMTTYRINLLKAEINLDPLYNILKEQLKSVGADDIPKVQLLRPDCLVLGCWQNVEVAPEPTRKQVVVDAICGAAVLRGAHVFAPGVMAMSSDLKYNEDVDIYADLEGSCKKGLKVPYDGKKLFVARGVAKMLRNELFGENLNPRGIAIHVVIPASKVPVVDESIWLPGACLLQNLPSIVCSWVLDPKPNERILDMCAAPGNKTTHLAELTQDKAHIIAIDRVASRVAKINESCKRNGITNVQAYVYDSIKCCGSKDSPESQRGPPFAEDSFDRILLDAPCSALGQRPLLYNKMTAKTLNSYKCLQRNLFATAVKLLKPGGQLVYSTCTVNQGENESLVSWALARFPTLELVPADPLVGGPGWPHAGLNETQRLMVQRFGPEEDNMLRAGSIYTLKLDSVGFFIASFRKNKNTPK